MNIARWTKANIRQSFAFLLLAAFLSAGVAQAQDRVALVIGNGAYTNASSLLNPPNDAADMASALRELGFDVIAATNVDKVSFDKKIREFATALRQAKTALFFYAGHGMQVAGRNYAVPIDARLESAADLQVETVDIDQVLSVMQADENRVNLIFLDACRDNPLTRSFARALPATRAVAVGSGLTAVDAGRGTLIAFATAPNKVALDGRGRNSPFTTALLKHIRTPGLDIAFVLRRVTADVEAASQGTQVPWVHASLTTDVMLKRGEGTAALPLAPIATPGPTADEITWSVLKDTKDIEQLQRFLQQFPSSARRNEVEERIASLGQAGTAPPIKQSAPAPAAKIETPRETLPAQVPVDEAVLKLVETHPFFANAPPVLVDEYRVKSNLKTTGAGAGSYVSDNRTTVSWLRKGLTKEELAMDTTNANAAGSLQSTSESISVSAGNGFITLGNKTITRNRFGTTPVISKTSRIDNLWGHLFPVTVGNKFGYSSTSQWNTTSAGSHYKGETAIKQACEVTQRREAKIFQSELTGAAYIVHCKDQTLNRNTTSTASTTESTTVFFENLGVWVTADPVSPRERIVSNGAVATYGKYTSTSNGSYSLESFSLAR